MFLSIVLAACSDPVPVTAAPAPILDPVEVAPVVEDDAPSIQSRAEAQLYAWPASGIATFGVECSLVLMAKASLARSVAMDSRTADAIAALESVAYRGTYNFADGAAVVTAEGARAVKEVTEIRDVIAGTIQGTLVLFHTLHTNPPGRPEWTAHSDPTAAGFIRLTHPTSLAELVIRRNTLLPESIREAGYVTRLTNWETVEGKNILTGYKIEAESGTMVPEISITHARVGDVWFPRTIELRETERTVTFTFTGIAIKQEVAAPSP